MTHDDTVAFLLRRQDNFLRRDVAALTADHLPDGVVHSPLFPHVSGTAAIQTSYRTLFTIFPDWELLCDPPIVDGSRAAHPFTARATHVGEFMGLPGTGRRFQIHGCLLYSLRDGLIAEERRVYDFTGLLIQLGVLRGRTARQT